MYDQTLVKSYSFIIADNIGFSYHTHRMIAEILIMSDLINNYFPMTIIGILQLSNSQGNNSFKCAWVEMECESCGVDLCPPV